jgi:hypothetical protein
MTKQCQLVLATLLMVSLECYARNLRQVMTQQPSASVCRQEGSFRYPTDCRKFYRCVDWSHEGKHFSIFHFDCPEGTVFDEDLQVCNFPWWTKPCLQGMLHPPVVLLPGDGGSFGVPPGSEDLMMQSESEDLMIQSGTNNPFMPIGMAPATGPVMKPVVPGLVGPMFPESVPMFPDLPFGQETIISGSDGSNLVSIPLLPGEAGIGTPAPAEGGSQSSQGGSNGSSSESENSQMTQVGGSQSGFGETPAGGSQSGFGETSTQTIVPQGGQDGNESSNGGSQSGSDSDSSSGSSSSSGSLSTTGPPSSTSDSSSGSSSTSDSSSGSSSTSDSSSGSVSTSDSSSGSSTTSGSSSSSGSSTSAGSGVELPATGETGSQVVESGVSNPGNEENNLSSSTAGSQTPVNQSEASNSGSKPGNGSGQSSTNPSLGGGSQSVQGSNGSQSESSNSGSKPGNGSDQTSTNPSLGGGSQSVQGTDGSQSESSNNEGNDSNIPQSETSGTGEQHLQGGHNDGENNSGIDIQNGSENGLSSSISDQLPATGNSSLLSQAGNSSDSNNSIDVEAGTTQGKYMVMEGSIFNCPEPGFYPYESNCLEFYVCLEVLPGILFAEQLYRCPSRYLFDDVSRRCLREGKVNCTKFSLESVSPLGKENVLVVLEQFLDAFFNTPLYYRANVIG